MLDINKKHETSYCIPLSVRDEQIRLNVRRISGRIEQGEPKSEPVAIVGFGASLKKTWREVKKFQTIISVSGAHKFLLSKGITPNFHVEVDPREHKVELLGEPHKDVIYLPASCCHPKYIKHIQQSGAEIKLWHVFAMDGESEQVIPKGEWSLTGGCDVGMRAMTIARFLGYTDFHIFGLDGCIDKTGSHADAHPNALKKTNPTVYEGITYQTTPSLLESAKQVFHELDQMPDVTAKFYGHGLTQAMAKNYVRKTTHAPQIAEMRPELISEELREMNRQLHEENPYYGIGGGKYAETVINMKTAEISSVLDYGAGKQQLAKSLPFPIWSYDPAIPEISESPRPADLVVCTDVLEHIEPEKLAYVLDDLKRVTQKIGYFVIHLGAAQKTYADGRNAHLIQQPPEWWNKKLSRFFDVATSQVKGKELHIIVTPKTHKDSPEAIIGIRGKDGIKSRFYVPNETARWRAESLLTKEPVTIEWLNNIPKDAVLFDVGANIGGYSVWAGVRGVEVVAFEPEAENYAMLVKNIALNGLATKAFCLAVNDKTLVDTLHMSTRGLGGSCHSFGKAVDAFGEHRNGNHPEQACVGMSIDELVEKGLPSPDYIKIDVDGFEPRVIAGAHKALKTVKGMLIEVNPALPEHLSMIDQLTHVFGFAYNEEQVRKSTRTDGAFKGVAEYVFYRETETDRHIAKAIENAELISEPFPHLVVKDLLPVESHAKAEGEYYDFISGLPNSEDYVPIKKVRNLRGYPERFVAPTFERPEWIDSMSVALKKKFGLTGDYSDETLLIRDVKGYKIGPHTDATHRVLSAIFFLPWGDGNPGLGTSIYTPKDKSFKCEGGPHYSFDKFDKVKTIPYEPNTMFVFLKTDNSFHGVEETTETRNVLLYDLQKRRPQ